MNQKKKKKEDEDDTVKLVEKKDRKDSPRTLCSKNVKGQMKKKANRDVEKNNREKTIPPRRPTYACRSLRFQVIDQTARGASRITASGSTGAPR